MDDGMKNYEGKLELDDEHWWCLRSHQRAKMHQPSGWQKYIYEAYVEERTDAGELGNWLLALLPVIVKRLTKIWKYVFG